MIHHKAAPTPAEETAWPEKKIKKIDFKSTIGLPASCSQPVFKKTGVH
jgi:hypothetical protein